MLRLARDDKGGQKQFDGELQSLVAAARRHRLVLQVVLWSFDMCRNNGSPIRSSLISDRTKTMHYIHAALLPLLRSLDAAGCGGGRCVLEVINEPEWCIDDPRLDRCPAGTCVSAAHMQRFVALVAAAAHTHSDLRVTVGSASLKWAAPHTPDGRSVANLWSDDALTAAFDAALSSSASTVSSPPPPPLVLSCDRWCQERYADAHCGETGCLGCSWCTSRSRLSVSSSYSGSATLATTVGDWRDEPLDAATVTERLRAAVGRGARPTLDLYNSHFWNWQERTDGFGPCQQSFDWWRLDKPLVFAELPAHVHSHVDRFAAELTQCTIHNRFHGLLFWAHNDPGTPMLDAVAVLANTSRALPPSDASYSALVAWLQADVGRPLSTQAPTTAREEVRDKAIEASDAARSISATEQPEGCHGWCLNSLPDRDKNDGAGPGRASSSAEDAHGHDLNDERRCANTKCRACPMCRGHSTRAG